MRRRSRREGLTVSIRWRRQSLTVGVRERRSGRSIRRRSSRRECLTRYGGGRRWRRSRKRTAGVGVSSSRARADIVRGITRSLTAAELLIGAVVSHTRAIAAQLIARGVYDRIALAIGGREGAREGRDFRLWNLDELPGVRRIARHSAKPNVAS